MKLIVRITDKSGSRIERHTLGNVPLTVGRAWDNDVILQDPFVDADHLAVRLFSSGDDAGGIAIDELQTTNGTVVANKSIAGDGNRYRIGDQLRVGDTSLEILDASIAVEKTTVRSFWFFMRERFHSLTSLVWLTLVTLAVVVCDTQLRTAEPIKWSNGLLTISLTLLFLFIWSLLFGFVSKLLRGESNIRAHWALVCVAIMVVTMLAWVLTAISFNLQAVDLSRAMIALVMGAVAVLFFYALLTYATHLSSRTKSSCSVIVVLAIIATTYSDALLKEPHQRWTAQARTETANLPPTFKLRSANDLDQYMQEASALFSSSDSLVDE